MSRTMQRLFEMGGTIIASLALVACGDETNVTKVTNETIGMEVAVSADSLGACDSAAIGKTVFASSESSVYICADSGWVPLSKAAASGKDGADGENGTDGKDGTDGASCTVKALPDSSGYKVVCGGDSVGVILNGADGKNGASGENGMDGRDGTNGTSCTVAALSDGSGYKIVCGGDSVGVVLNGADGKDRASGESGCRLASDSSGVVKFVCAASDTVTLYKAICGVEAYDPAEKFCFADSLYPLCGGSRYNAFKEHCKNDTVSEGFGEFVDARDGQVYKMVKIGSQIWMAENLNYNYNEGTNNSSCYNDSSVYCKKYGRLYTWTAATLACPKGWHLPTRVEFVVLNGYLTANSTDGVGNALKSTSGWTEHNSMTKGSDEFGFGALPAGRYYSSYDEVLNNAYFWIKTYSYKGSIKTGYYYMCLYYNTWGMSIAENTTSSRNEIRYSVRCVKDESSEE